MFCLGPVSWSKEPQKRTKKERGILSWLKKPRFQNVVYFNKKINQEFIPIIAYVYMGEEQFVFYNFFDDVRWHGVLNVEINTRACLIVPKCPVANNKKCNASAGSK